jgi:hypothetical protein
MQCARRSDWDKSYITKQIKTHSFQACGSDNWIQIVRLMLVHPKSPHCSLDTTSAAEASLPIQGACTWTIPLTNSLQKSWHWSGFINICCSLVWLFWGGAVEVPAVLFRGPWQTCSLFHSGGLPTWQLPPQLEHLSLNRLSSSGTRVSLDQTELPPFLLLSWLNASRAACHYQYLLLLKWTVITLDSSWATAWSSAASMVATLRILRIQENRR